MKKRLHTYRRLLRLARETDKSFWLVFWLSMLLTGLFPVLISFVTKAITAVVEHRSGSAVVHLLVLVGLYLVLGLLSAYFGAYIPRSTYTRRTYVRLFGLQQELRQQLNLDYQRVDSKSFLQQYLRGRRATEGNERGLEGILQYTVHLGAPALSLLLLFILLALWRPVIALGLLAYVLLYYYAENQKNLLEAQSSDELKEKSEQIKSLGQELGELANGKEIRLYQLNRPLLELYHRLISRISAIFRQTQRRALLYQLLPLAFMILLQLLFGYLLIEDYKLGRIQTDSFLFYLTVMGQIILLLDQQVSTFAFYIMHELDDVENFFELIDDKDDRPRGVRTIDLSHPPEIEFRNVSFSYAEAGKPVFSGLNFKIHSGESVALVGHNGAGKSTLVKLLCGLYYPDEGEILINGHRLEDYPKSELASLFSVVFQKVNSFPLTVGENLAMAEKVDKAKARAALTEVGLDSWLDQLPKGLDQPMGSSLEDEGVKLSGGQAQKLAFARCLYKNAPMLVLDEPTSALDALAESELYQQMHSLSRNKSALFISHRLSSTGFCDRVVLLKEGRVAEEGTHAELMAAGGEYAQLYALQAKYYQEEADHA